jgi:hypothetical protein
VVRPSGVFEEILSIPPEAPINIKLVHCKLAVFLNFVRIFLPRCPNRASKDKNACPGVNF